MTDSILGIRIGSDVEDARAKLNALAVDRGPESHGEDETEEREGRKQAWTLKATPYRSIAVQADRRGRIAWVTGFVRPGKEIPFSKLGDPSLALRATASQAIWNVPTESGGYRLVARGRNGRASVVSLLSLESPRPD